MTTNELGKLTSISLTAKPHDAIKGQNLCHRVLTCTHVTVSEYAVLKAVLLPVQYHLIESRLTMKSFIILREKEKSSGLFLRY